MLENESISFGNGDESITSMLATVQNNLSANNDIISKIKNQLQNMLTMI